MKTTSILIVILFVQLCPIVLADESRSIEEYAFEDAFSVLFMPDTKYPYFQSMLFGYQPTHALNSPLWHAELALLLYNSKEFILSQLEALQVNVNYYDSPRTDTQAILVQSLNNCHAIFRGTEPFNVKDALTDSMFWVETWQGGGKVHKGFLRAIDDLFQTTSLVSDMTKCDQITMAGHSLGAALATLAADLIPEVKKLYTFGSPRVGNQKFIRMHSVPTVRYIHSGDGINHLPLRSMGFLHSTTAVYLPPQHKFDSKVSWSYFKKKIFRPFIDHAMAFYCLALFNESRSLKN